MDEVKAYYNDTIGNGLLDLCIYSMGGVTPVIDELNLGATFGSRSLSIEEMKWINFLCTQIGWLKMKLERPQTGIPYIFSDVAFSCPYCGCQFRWSPANMCQESYQIPIEYNCGTVIVYTKDPRTDMIAMRADNIRLSDECRMRRENESDSSSEVI